MTDIQERFTIEEGCKKITIDKDQYIEIIDQLKSYKLRPFCVIVSRYDRAGDLILQHFSVKDLETAISTGNHMFGFLGPFEDEELAEEPAKT